MRKTLAIAALASALGAAPAFADCTLGSQVIFGMTVPALICDQSSTQTNNGGNGSQTSTQSTSVCEDNGQVVPCS